MRDKIYSALDIAKYVIISSNRENIPITNLRLQKLMYYIKHFYLKVHKRVLYSDVIEAWDYGPVLPEVYKEFKQWGGFRIPSNSLDFNENLILNEDKDNITEIIKSLSKYPTGILVEETHKHKGWKRAYNSDNKIITDEEIENFYE